MTTRTWWRLGAVATSIVASAQFVGCRFPHGTAETDGGSDVPPDVGICAGSSLECVGDKLRTCVMAGSEAVDVDCVWGCMPSPDPHCGVIAPAGGNGDPTMGVTGDDLDPTDLADIVLGDGVQIDTDDGQIGPIGMPNMFHTGNEGLENGIDFRFRGPISMFRFKSLTINGTITLVGRRPIALVVSGSVTINGVIDARGPCPLYRGGPGGFWGGSGSGQDGEGPMLAMAGGGGAPASTSGGGGGGHGGGGGSGKAAAGGVPFGDPEITVLVGGAGGGAGSGGTNFGRGGGGGGALQIVSNDRISITSGGINAGGCGGDVGGGTNDSGGGGGAGGTILLEAPTVVVAGTLAANGGGGGGGGGGGTELGSNGILGTMPAAGGSGDGTNEQGGAGAATGAAPGVGGTGTNPGGGGGGLGRIRINTRGGSGAELTQSVLSPGPPDGMPFSSGSPKTL